MLGKKTEMELRRKTEVSDGMGGNNNFMGRLAKN